ATDRLRVGDPEQIIAVPLHRLRPLHHLGDGRAGHEVHPEADVHHRDAQPTPRYARCTCSLAATSAAGPSSTTRPCSMTYTTWARVKARRAFCSTSRIVTPRRFTSSRRRYTSCTMTGASPCDIS